MRVALAALLVACGSVPRAQMIAEVESAPQRATLAAPVVFGPVARRATAYNEPAGDVPSTAARDQLFTALVETAKDKGEPQRDSRLDLLAGELSELVARGGVADDDLIEFVLHEHGIPEPMHALLVSHAATPEAALVELEPQLLDSLRVANVHVGIGGGDGQPFVVAIIHTSLVTLPPTVPRALAAHGELTFSASIDSSMHSPRITVAYDDDREARDHPKATRVDPVTFSATIACGDHKGNLWMLVEACDAKNVVQRLLLVPVSCDEPLETSYRIEPRANTEVAPAELEHRLAAIINRERAAAGVQILGGDLRASNAARTETALMRRNHSVEHDLAKTTTIGRLRDEGLMAPFTLEATLHAKDLATASEILLNHRGYREMLSKPEPTHLGISIEYDEAHQLFIAIDLVSIIPKIDTARIEANMLARIDARRPELERRQWGPLERNKLLDHVAWKYVLNRARGWGDPTVSYETQHDVELDFGNFGTSWRALTLLLTDDPSLVDIGPDQPFDGVGVAALQAPRNGALAGRTYVIVIYGKRRP
ncbi:MAG: hypothetical protein ABI591_21435 [Kofleriaceae bacterium]